MKDHIIQGMKNAYDDLVKFEDYNFLIRTNVTEYFFTVAVAKSLSEHIKSLPGNLTIHFEYPSDFFVQHAFDNFKYQNVKGKEHIERKFIKRQKHKSVRKGRIDIAILSKIAGNIWTHSVHGIEVKGINPSKKALKKDFTRLEEALLKTDKIGENSIESCFITFIKRLDNPKQVFGKNHYHAALIKYYPFLDEFQKNRKLIIEIDHFSVYKHFFEDYVEGMKEDEIDDTEVAIYTGALEGFVITMKRK